MDEYEFHPFADAFPMMTDREHAELVADIKANGQRDAITLYRGKILDGRNRDEACRELGIKANYIDSEGDDAAALAFVISKNLMRRQLTASQRAMVAARLSTLKHGQHKSDTSIDVSQAEAAKRMNVSLPSTQRARKVIDNGGPELIAAVERGDIAVSAAASKIDGRGSDGKVADRAPPPKRTSNVHVAEPEIDASTLSMSEQDKLAAAIRQEKRKLLEGYHETVRLAVVDGAKEYLASYVLPHFAELERRYRAIVESRTRGIMEKKTFRLILSCLHTDSRKSASDERLNEAFNAFSHLETKLMSERDDPSPPKFNMPKTMEEWNALKAKVKAERKSERMARRGHQNVARR
jgi:hypothetical protein